MRKPGGLRTLLTSWATSLLLAGCALSPQQASDRIDQLVDAAWHEWHDWGQQRVREQPGGGLCAELADASCQPVQDGCGRELSGRYCELVNRYWPLVGNYRHPCEVTDVCLAQRPPGIEAIYTEPWSAAFISYLFHRAGFGRFRFTLSDTHADYVSATRDGLMPDFELIATPLRPRRGDLLCIGRGPDRELAPLQIDAIANAASGPQFTRMHCDLVVAVTASQATLIGGNVAQAVSLREITLDDQGMARWQPPPYSGWLLALRLKAAARQPSVISQTAIPDARKP